MLSLYVRFKLVPSTKVLFVAHLAELMKTMAEEPTFVSAVLSEDTAAEDELVLFEVWNGSQKNGSASSLRNRTERSMKMLRRTLLPTKRFDFCRRLCFKISLIVAERQCRVGQKSCR
ncbi:hypothetical protein OKW40_005743 [Paraburkholderia sp. RAU6.4a]|uniref:antibiotic biosynthesis monooxygenase n=1 Tax=Paraburkholderia sp. RAU6.4a TaxID=2991067 RepID=UPI003D1B6941